MDIFTKNEIALYFIILGFYQDSNRLRNLSAGYKTASEVLLGGQWYNNILASVDMPQSDFFDFLDKYNSKAKNDVV